MIFRRGELRPSQAPARSLDGSRARPGTALATACLLLASLVRVTEAPASVEWPSFAGGLRRLFFNHAETQITAANVADLRVKWRFRANAIVTASPSVAVVDLPGEGPTQVVFIQSWDHTLYALRLRDGTEVWRFPFPDNPGGSYPNVSSVDVSVVGGIQCVFVASEQRMYSIDARTGVERWHFDAGTGCADPPGLCGFSGERNEIESSPLVAGGNVVFGMDVNDSVGGKGGLYGVRATDGALAWFFDLESGMTCRPDPGDDVRRYDGYHGEAELGLPAGFFASRAGCDHPRTPNGCSLVWSSVAYDAGRGLVFTVSGNCDTDNDPASLRPFPPMPPFDEAIFALHDDGTPAWRWRPREVDTLDLDFGAVPNLFTIDVDGTPRDVIGVGGKDGTYYVIDRTGVNARSGVRWDDADASALPYWRRNVVAGGPQGGILATAAVDEVNARIHFSTAPGTSVFDPQRPTVHALDMHTGTVLWQNTAEANADASFASVSGIPGVVFVGGAGTGALRAYDAATGAKLASHQVAFVLASPPAVVDGLVVLGGGIGVQSGNPADPADIVSRLPSDVTALCVPGSVACDEDQDGVDFPEDCDDRDARRHVGARELPDDGVDQDCDGFDAHGGDDCLAGGSAGQDRRDLDGLRAAMDAACPCATATGRSRYRRCVAPIVRAAIDGGTLRRACKRLLVAATCGRIGDVVCCEERLANASHACRVTQPRRCTNTSRVVRTVLAGATHCADTDCTLAAPTTTTSVVTTSTTSTTTTTLPPSWAAIWSAAIGPTCGSCHGASGPGGLDGLHDCNAAYANTVGVASVELPSMNRIQPGSPATSWLVHKVDGTQNAFTGQCPVACGGQMPPNTQPLDAATRTALRTWIMNGAANDCP